MRTVVGAHNAMTFLRARRWWWRLLGCFWRCQERTPAELFSRGVRCFDLRVRIKRDGRLVRWEFAHGMVSLESHWYVERWIDEIASLASDDDPVMIRLILEDIDNSHREYECDMFRGLCEWCENHYPMVRFIGGWLKPGWVPVYSFGEEPEVVQPVSSMAEDARWWERVLPRVYWKRAGRFAVPEGEVCLMDFV